MDKALRHGDEGWKKQTRGTCDRSELKEVKKKKKKGKTAEKKDETSKEKS